MHNATLTSSKRKRRPKSKDTVWKSCFINETDKIILVFHSFCFFRVEPLCAFNHILLYGFVYESLLVTLRITSDFAAHIRIIKRCSKMLSVTNLVASHTLQLHITHGLQLPSFTAQRHTHFHPPLHQLHSCHQSLIKPDCLATPVPHSLTHI